MHAAVGVHAGAEAGRRAGAEPEPAAAVRRLLAQRDPALPRGQQYHVHLWYATICSFIFIFLLSPNINSPMSGANCYRPTMKVSTGLQSFSLTNETPRFVPIGTTQ